MVTSALELIPCMTFGKSLASMSSVFSLHVGYNNGTLLHSMAVGINACKELRVVSDM